MYDEAKHDITGTKNCFFLGAILFDRRKLKEYFEPYVHTIKESVCTLQRKIYPYSNVIMMNFSYILCLILEKP